MARWVGNRGQPRVSAGGLTAMAARHGFTGDLVRWLCPSHNEFVIHLRVVSPTDVTTTLVPVLGAEPAVLNLTVLPGAARNPDGDAVYFDVLHGAANEVIGCAILGWSSGDRSCWRTSTPRSPRSPTGPRRGAGGSSSSRRSGRRSRPGSRWTGLPAELVRAAGHRRADRGHRDPHQLADPD